MPKNKRLIESDCFPFEFLSQLAERESWRKEVHRPVYHVHKWWAKRLGTVFRGMLLGCTLRPSDRLEAEFYNPQSREGLTVLDPFMGSGTTVGEAHKLGFTSLGRDINPVAVNAARVAFGPLDRHRIEESFQRISQSAGVTIRKLYEASDSLGRLCDVLYHFWVMQAECLECRQGVDLFSSYVIASNAYPKKKPGIQILCPKCGDVFPGMYGQKSVICQSCRFEFDPTVGPARGAKARCSNCGKGFAVLKAVAGERPSFRQYAKLVLTKNGEKEYLPSTQADQEAYQWCSETLRAQVESGKALLPCLELERGYNTRQAMSYGFRSWKDFFNDRQLLALSCLRSAIEELEDASSREALRMLFSGVLEFNNLFASYKGEGTGAVRHMFAHHILKPERTPIEANVWGTPKSSGAFSNLFRSRLLRAIAYREAPTEIDGPQRSKPIVCSPPFTGMIHPWGNDLPPRAIALSCGDSSKMQLSDQSIDLIITDPPFFDNVHYSELADFFFSWQQIGKGDEGKSTRSELEVQDADAQQFSAKLEAVFRECNRVLRDEGLFVFTYHHSRDAGWKSLASALLGAGFVVVNSHPVKGEMSVAAPKSQAKEPIQLDIILVCTKRAAISKENAIPTSLAIESAISKIQRMFEAGFKLSRNDQKIILFGQMLTTLANLDAIDRIAAQVEMEMARLAGAQGEWNRLSDETRAPFPLESTQQNHRQGVLFE